MFHLLLIFTGLLGLVVGSFINVLTLRWNPVEDNQVKKIVRGRSRCLHCGKNLRWFELIPILSFIFLRGRCRYCHKKLFLQYPLVEGLTALIFTGVAWRILNFNFFSYHFFSDPRANFWVAAIIITWFFYAAVFITLSVIDLRHYLLPDKIIFPAIAVSLLANVSFYSLSLTRGNSFPKHGLNFLGSYADVVNIHFNALTSAIAGAIVLFSFLFLIYVLSRGRAMGFGDVKLAILMGLMLGFSAGIVSLLLSFVVGAVVSLIIVLTTKKKLKDAVPFGPFLALGVLAVFFFGQTITNFYFSLFNV
ncbi:MAG: prepilin peptidase [bacterium]|nr:prepilin peptidase [bacterium]